MTYSYHPHESLLEAFQALFQGNRYRHRDQTRGNWVAAHLFNDLVTLATPLVPAPKFIARVHSGSRVRGRDVSLTVSGKKARRGDCTFGQAIPGVVSKPDPGFTVPLGRIAQVEIGAEAKIMLKAQIRQLGRVIKDLEGQVGEFRMTKGNPICVALVGVNYADYCVSYEGRKKWKTDGKKHTHPAAEAEQTERRVIGATGYDEFITLPFKATNDKPYDFEWKDFTKTRIDYGALLLRVASEYEKRF